MVELADSMGPEAGGSYTGDMRRHSHGPIGEWPPASAVQGTPPRLASAPTGAFKATQVDVDDSDAGVVSKLEASSQSWYVSLVSGG